MADVCISRFLNDLNFLLEVSFIGKDATASLNVIFRSNDSLTWCFNKENGSGILAANVWI